MIFPICWGGPGPSHFRNKSREEQLITAHSFRGISIYPGGEGIMGTAAFYGNVWQQLVYIMTNQNRNSVGPSQEDPPLVT